MNPTTMRPGHPFIIAHRGANAPENTVAAYENAIAMGVDAVELDIHMTSDGELVCIHDDTLDRTTSATGSVGKLSLAELRETGSGSVSADAADSLIPTLQEVLRLVRGRCFLAIEVKMPDRYPGIGDRLLGVLRDHGMLSATLGGVPAVVVASFDPTFLRELVIKHPELKVFQLTPPGAKLSARFVEGIARYATGIAPFLRDVTDEAVEIAHGLDMLVFPYTAETADEMNRLLDAGVDGIITDDCATLRRMLDSR